MKKVTGNAKVEIEFTINLTLTKGEALALDAIAGYGADEFLNVFYQKMGKSYLQPHEAEMRSLFKVIRAKLPNEIDKINNAEAEMKKVLNNFK